MVDRVALKNIAQIGTWLDGSIRAIPYAGPTYSYLAENVASPVAVFACKLSDVVLPSLKAGWTCTKTQLGKHPYITAGAAVAFTAVVIRALASRFCREPKTGDDSSRLPR